MPTTSFDVAERAAESSIGVSAVNHGMLIVSQTFSDGMGHNAELVRRRFVDAFIAVPSFNDIPVASNIKHSTKTMHQPTFELDFQVTRIALNMVKEE